MLRDTMFPAKRILFIIGSPNQTSQMQQIASMLSEYDCYFSQIYRSHPIIRSVQRAGLLDKTIFGGEFKRKGDAYLEKHGLLYDYTKSLFRNDYDMALICSA